MKEAMTNTVSHKRTKTITVNNLDLKGGMELCLPSGGAMSISGIVYPSGVMSGLVVVETEIGTLYLDNEGASTVLDPDATQPTLEYHHLVITSDGEIEVNELFTTNRALAKYLMKTLDSGGLAVEVDDYRDAIAEADADAAQGDHMEGVTPKIPGDPEEYLDCIKDLLSTNDLDMYINTLSAPVNA